MKTVSYQCFHSFLLFYLRVVQTSAHSFKHSYPQKIAVILGIFSRVILKNANLPERCSFLANTIVVSFLSDEHLFQSKWSGWMNGRGDVFRGRSGWEVITCLRVHYTANQDSGFVLRRTGLPVIAWAPAARFARPPRKSHPLLKC